MRWLFLLAYACSGLAGLVYQVSWTRLLTLYIGHTTAAASAVVAAFLGGLAAGAWAGGVLASRWPRRTALKAYVGLELGVALVALGLPWALDAITPLLAWAYRDGAGGWLFPVVRLASCLALIFIPAAALGAAFPMAIQWFATESGEAAASSGTLYAVNTAGAAIGSIAAGFVLMPAIGLRLTTATGMAASAIAAACVLVVLWTDGSPHAAPPVPSARKREPQPKPAGRRTSRAHVPSEEPPQPPPAWLPGAILGLSGFAALVHEIVWTRVLALVLGPTIYAFAATLAAVIAGVAIGSALGTAILRRTRQPVVWLSGALALAAITASAGAALAGTQIPHLAAQQMANPAPDFFGQLLRQSIGLTATFVLPTASCLGAAFPLALALFRESGQPAGRFANVYAINTIGSVSGSLAAGFLLIPWLGLQSTLRLVCVCLVAAVALVAACGRVPTRVLHSSIVAAAASFAVLAFSPAWDRDLLASGAYLYAAFVPKDLDLDTLLKAGQLLYYRDGASATVSVKRLTGTTTLAVDGKTDASNRGDMLTQKLVAHLPLLVHDNPRDVAIVGLGSGVTLGAALRHPIARADVLEISPEVVEASHFFDAENHHALDDPRTNLIVGDGRSHLMLSRRQYDVIISEPSNPWIAGVASLFTQEFFRGARERLSPGGVMCQWANAYNISDRDLRSIVATFRSVFPNGTVWLVGTDDVLMLGSKEEGPLDARLQNIERFWTRPGVAADLAEVLAMNPFALWSLYAGGPGELADYTDGAPLLTDDRMTLEFSAPRELHASGAGDNGQALARLLGAGGPPASRQARDGARASDWRQRGAMMSRRDAHSIAYEDYVRALQMDPADAEALDGLVRTAILTSRGSDALAWIKSLPPGRADRVRTLVAQSKLLSSIDAGQDAIDAARQASTIPPVQPFAVEQLASLHADAGDRGPLADTLERLHQLAPEAAPTLYYEGVSALLNDRPEDAVRAAERSIAADANYAPVYDLLGAAHTKLGHTADARQAFERSLSFDPHDSTAYTNLGLIALAEGNHPAAARLFAEALWLAPNSPVAREGLAQSTRDSLVPNP